MNTNELRVPHWTHRSLESTIRAWSLEAEQADPEFEVVYGNADRIALAVESSTWFAEKIRIAAYEGFERGFTALAHQHMAQRADPSHAITRINPYVRDESGVCSNCNGVGHTDYATCIFCMPRR